MKPIHLWLISAFLVGIIIGLNINENAYNNVWPEERNGLRTLNDQMKDDDSERLAMAVITEKNQYQILAIDAEKYELGCALREVPKERLEERWRQVHGMK